MTDVAKLAGVSQSCVSLVLNDAPGARVPESTRLRVIDAAQKLGYQLPEPRRQRKTQATAAPAARPTICFLVDEISVSPHSVLYLDGARDAAWMHERTVQAYVTRSNKFLEDTIISEVVSQSNIIGVIYASSFTRQVEVPEPLAAIPTVLVDCYSPTQSFPTVLANDTGAGFSATQHMILYGHKRIGMINGERWMDASRDRLRGYRQALTAASIEFDPGLVKVGDWSVRSGYVRTMALMQSQSPPTAFYCANDMMAWGCMQALAELGLSVPEDVSVVGHNDQLVAASTVPPLTTCRPPNYEMGTQAAELLLEAAQLRKTGKPPVMELDCQLIGRSSVSFRKGSDGDNDAAGTNDTLAPAAPATPRPGRARGGNARSALAAAPAREGSHES
jgi:LacI family transcriptional regulator